jgi:hypothetical protein
MIHIFLFSVPAVAVKDSRDRRRSKMWLHFSNIHRDGKLLALCNLCEANDVLLKRPNWSTTSLHKHLQRWHPAEFLKLGLESKTVRRIGKGKKKKALPIQKTPTDSLSSSAPITVKTNATVKQNPPPSKG